MTGTDLLMGFKARYAEISMRKPEAASLAQARTFNKPQVSK